jgi:hypothetical protein
MIKQLRWIANRRALRAAMPGFALALAFTVAPAAYGADGNPWHINIHRDKPARTNTAKATAYGADRNPWHINIHRDKPARTNTVKATAYGADRNPWHINIYGDTSSPAALASLSTAPAAAATGAATPVSVDVSGTQTVIDEAAGTFAMHGSLVGVWQTTKFVPRYQSSSRFVATGKEEFTGCLDANTSGACDKKDPSGTLKFTFMYWASFDPATGALLHGNCVHPVIGGSGDFRKAAGVILMEDTPTGTDVVTTYSGTIEYQGPKAGQGARHRTLASAGSGGNAGVCGGS